MRYLFLIFLTAASAYGIELSTGIRNFTLLQIEGMSVVSITNSTGGNISVRIYDAPSTNLARNVSNRVSVQRVIGQAPSNLVVTNLPYRNVTNFTITNGNYQLYYPRGFFTFGLTVSNTGPISVGTK